MTKITINSITKIAIYLSFLLVLKFSLSFLAGPELISFGFILAGFIFTQIELLYLIFGFVLLMMLIHGPLPWVLVYFPMYLTFSQLTFILKNKLLKNVFFFTIWVFLCASSIWIFYFLFNDWYIYGFNYAISIIPIAIMTNLIGGFFNALFAFALYPYLIKIISINNKKKLLEKKQYR